MIRFVPLFFTLLLLNGCGHQIYRGKNVVGADQFVLDSYKIRQGKFAILELEGQYYDELGAHLLDEYKDVIQDGDVLNIVVFHPSRVDIINTIQGINHSGFPVREGKVRLPDLEPIQVEGFTLGEAAEHIERAYGKGIKDLQVFLSYRDRLEKKVELAGMVSVPNILVDGKIRLFEVLSKAKIAPQANLFKSYVVRGGSMLPVDLFKLLKEGDMTQNIVMRGGDKIYVADTAAANIMVLGEVGKEKLIGVPNGFMTIREAIAEAGGILPTGNKSYIQIVRGNILNPKIYTITWDHVVHLPSESLLLMPGDIVIVAATPITQWNRFMTQLSPTLINIDLVARGIKGIGVNIPS